MTVSFSRCVYVYVAALDTKAVVKTVHWFVVFDKSRVGKCFSEETNHKLGLPPGLECCRYHYIASGFKCNAQNHLVHKKVRNYHRFKKIKQKTSRESMYEDSPTTSATCWRRYSRFSSTFIMRNPIDSFCLPRCRKARLIFYMVKRKKNMKHETWTNAFSCCRATITWLSASLSNRNLSKIPQKKRISNFKNTTFTCYALWVVQIRLFVVGATASRCTTPSAVEQI